MSATSALYDEHFFFNFSSLRSPVFAVSKHDELYKKGDSGSDSSSGGGRKEGGGTPFAKNNAKNRRKR